MAKGKQTCKILKEIRKQIAAENDIDLVVSECTYQGDCLGTCPKCESEVRYLERELEKRQRLGKAAVFAGMSLGTLLAATACDTTAKVPSNPKCPSGTEVTQGDSIPERRLEGDVVAIDREPQEPDTNVFIINRGDLMGLVELYSDFYSFDAAAYRNLLQSKFVFPKMEGLSVVSGEIKYNHDSSQDTYESLEELAKAATEFRAPYYDGGEEKFLQALADELKGLPNINKYAGNMEVEFTVEMEGEVDEVKVVKGINKTLNDAVVAAMTKMEWEPGEYELEEAPFPLPMKCRCVKKIHFPIKTK